MFQVVLHRRAARYFELLDEKLNEITVDVHTGVKTSGQLDGNRT